MEQVMDSTKHWILTLTGQFPNLNLMQVSLLKITWRTGVLTPKTSIPNISSDDDKQVEPIYRITPQKTVSTTRVFRKYTPQKKQDVIPFVKFYNGRIVDVYC
jgi:hypothetical protein